MELNLPATDGAPFNFYRGAWHLAWQLAENAAAFPDHEAISSGDERFTWAEVDARVEALAAAFLRLGVERGDRIGILCPNVPEFVFVYLAAARVGAVLAGFNVQHTAREVLELAAIARPVVVVLMAEREPTAPLFHQLAALPYVRHVVVIGEPQPLRAVAFARLLLPPPVAQRQAVAARQGQLKPDDPALLVFSGGVTGAPKAAVLTHRNIIASIAAQNHYLDWRQDDKAVQHLPMNHVSGGLLVVGTLLAASSMVMLERFHPEQTLAVIQRERVTILGQVPTMFIMEFLHPEFARYDLSSLRMTIVSGAPTPPFVMQRITELAPVAIHGYGLTESSGMVSYHLPGAAAEQLLRSAGRAAPEFEVQIVDAARQPLPRYTEGEIAVRGASIMAEYFENPAETARIKDAAGWLYTGDLGRLDEEGRLTITGRSKEMYICGGYNVFPLEVETYLNTHPGVAASACIGMPESVLGEIGAVYVAPRPGAHLTTADIRAYCRQGLARYKQPRDIIIRHDLPLTSSGQVDKVALREHVIHR